MVYSTNRTYLKNLIASSNPIEPNNFSVYLKFVLVELCLVDLRTAICGKESFSHRFEKNGSHDLELHVRQLKIACKKDVLLSQKLQIAGDQLNAALTVLSKMTAYREDLSPSFIAKGSYPYLRYFRFETGIIYTSISILNSKLDELHFHLDTLLKEKKI